MRLADATWTDVRDADADLAVLPVGSTEGHGPHAPLGTDSLTAETVADAGAAAYEAETGESVLVAPTIPVGISEEHRAFDGTLWVSPDTFRAYVRETAESLAGGGGPDAVVLVNGHGGNVDALREVAARLTRDGVARVAPFTWFEAVGEHTSDMGHAGPLETAFLRHERPDLVREDRVEAARENGSERWGDWVSGVNLAVDSDEFTGNGVVGDPSEGDAARGEELEELATAALVELLDALQERTA
ncbi:MULTISPECIES: creatininase family protein [Halolamina]|uniref:Creatinine amidohydrolase n=1 Tax=Halolamina pelagica TaxID=699431 RepID=A0A1I5RRZ5_9EURY|nr:MULTISPECIES: creatininase family protein [Halolamina]NHX35293.1 creatininase family protein [Halolamina sp. R1-12]SFP60736.1 creatinine amidohydrolase [Halolamina pelagica]